MEFQFIARGSAGPSGVSSLEQWLLPDAGQIISVCGDGSAFDEKLAQRILTMIGLHQAYNAVVAQIARTSSAGEQAVQWPFTVRHLVESTFACTLEVNARCKQIAFDFAKGLYPGMTAKGPDDLQPPSPPPGAR